MLALVPRAGGESGQYSRPEVLRIYGLSSRQLSAWEGAGLIAPRQVYATADLGPLKTLCILHAEGATTTAIRDLATAMKAIGEPFDDTRLIRTGTSYGCRFEGAILDPVRRQWLFDFDRIQPERERLISIGSSALYREGIQSRINQRFSSAVDAEEADDPKRAASLYEEILDLDPECAAASINLGTICYHQREYERAEQYYRRATEIDPEYPLAFFNLGNVLDELKRAEASIAAYRRAIEIAPDYADAHYNLGGVYEAAGERRLAIRHYEAYVRLDTTASEWAKTARQRIHLMLRREPLAVASRAIGPANQCAANHATTSRPGRSA